MGLESAKLGEREGATRRVYKNGCSRFFIFEKTANWNSVRNIQIAAIVR